MRCPLPGCGDILTQKRQCLATISLVSLINSRPGDPDRQRRLKRGHAHDVGRLNPVCKAIISENHEQLGPAAVAIWIGRTAGA